MNGRSGRVEIGTLVSSISCQSVVYCSETEGLMRKKIPPHTQAHRKCAPREYISMSVYSWAFVQEPTSGGKNKNPKQEKAAVNRLPNSEDCFKICVLKKLPNNLPKTIPANALAMKARIPIPSHILPSNMMVNGKMINGAMPTQGSHLDFSNLLKNSISIGTFYRIMLSDVIKLLSR